MCVLFHCFFFFFFKQKTAYEMRISDWSSDVCSSDLRGEPRAQYIVGTALFNGDLTAKNWVRAYALMTRASQSGLAQATASLRQMDKYIPQDQRNDAIAMAGSIGRQSATADEPRQIGRAHV